MRPARSRLTPILLLAALAACDGGPPTSPDQAGSIEEGRGGVPKAVGKITVIVNVSPDDPQDFRFTLTGQKRAAVLDDDADPTLLDSRSWPSLSNGSYSLALVNPLPVGYSLTGLGCDVGANATFTTNVPTATANITLSTGGDVTCTFSIGVNKSPLTITVNQATNQPDPTASPLVLFHVLANFRLVGLSAGDLQITNGTVAAISSAAETPEGLILYEIQVEAAADGPVNLAIPAGVVTNDFGTSNSASTSVDNSVTVDRSGPTVTLTPEGFAERCDDGDVIVQFSEPVTGFESADISLSGSDAGWGIIGFSGSGATYVVTISKGSTALNLTIPANAAVSATGKLSVASSTLTQPGGGCYEG